MSDEENWPGWEGGAPMHPRSRDRIGAQSSTIFGGFSYGSSYGWLPHPESPAGRGLTTTEIRAGNERYRASLAIQAAQRVHRFDSLTRLARTALGSQCFSLGVAYGLVKSPVVDAIGMLELVRLFVMTDLYDRIYGRRRWQGPVPPLGPGLAMDLGVRAALSMGLLERQWLEQAHREVMALLAELGRVLQDPLDYLGELPKHTSLFLSRKWAFYQACRMQSNLDGQLQAGVTLGELLYELLSIILGLATTVGAAAKLATKTPQLLKAARRLGRRPASGGPPGKALPPRATRTAQPEAPTTIREPRERASTSMGDGVSDPARIRAKERLTAIDDGALHNQQWESIKADNFEAKREGLKLEELSPEDTKARKLLENSGYSAGQVKQVLNSGRSFEPRQFKQGEALYAFDSADWVGKEQASPYWLDKKAYDDVAKLHKHGDVWDRHGVKRTLALPCYNKADGLVRAQVAENHVGVRSVVGRATENISYTAADGTIVQQSLSLPGGGYQLTPGLGQVVPINP